jgi:response regulator RpfG family c-di-GMP phosphodiesterase
METDMESPSSDISLLYVEDEPAIREPMGHFLKQRFSNVQLAADGREGLEIYQEMRPSIVITDICMPVMSGIEMTKEILEKDQDARIIVTSAHNQVDYLLEAINLGINHYLLKPLEISQIDAALERCISNIRSKRTITEHDSQISSAFNVISDLMDNSEQYLDSATPRCPEVEKHMDRMIETLFRTRNAPGHNGPSTVLVSRTNKNKGLPEWLWYECEGTSSIKKSHYLDHPPMKAVHAANDHALYFINNDEQPPADPLLAEFIKHCAAWEIPPKNLVWYKNGDCIICALDYPERVTSFDASVVKGLAVQAIYLQNISQQCAETEEAFGYTISSLARAAEANENDSRQHLHRVSCYCAEICKGLGFPDEYSARLSLQSQLHDVGKIHISPRILQQVGRLSPQENNIMREHTIIGARIIGAHPRLTIARKIALHHHERWDGSGYPFGLIGDYIPLEARIVNMADTYDALRSRKSYKPALEHDQACKAILEGDTIAKPSQFDPNILNTFKLVHEKFASIFEAKQPELDLAKELGDSGKIRWSDDKAGKLKAANS